MYEFQNNVLGRVCSSIITQGHTRHEIERQYVINLLIFSIIPYIKSIKNINKRLIYN